MFPRGETYFESFSGKFVELSEQQIAFMDEHPTATAKEWFDMELAPVIPPEPPEPPATPGFEWDGAYSLKEILEFNEGLMEGLGIDPDGSGSRIPPTEEPETGEEDEP